MRVSQCIVLASTVLVCCAAFAQTTTELAFTRTIFTPWDGFKATVGEPNNDSKRAFLGTRQDSDGNLVLWPADAMGVTAFFANQREASDTRIFDLGSNGLPALMGITHSCTNHTFSAAKLFTYNGTNYSENAAFNTSFNPPLRGHGETIVVADFANSGYLDLFLPYYTRTENPTINTQDGCTLTADSFPPSSRFLKNNGSMQFTDRTAFTAFARPEDSLSLTAPLYSDWQNGSTPEAVQAVDFDNDGWVDIYAMGRLFMNRSAGFAASARPKFQSLAYGLPTPRGIFDEGAKFLDWRNAGKLDLVVLAQNQDLSNPPIDPNFQIKLYEFDGQNFIRRTTGTDGGPLFRTKDGYAVPIYTCDTDGLNVADLNNDGLEDVIVGASLPPVANPDPDDPCQGPANTHPVQIFLNRGGYFELDNTPDTDPLANGTGGMAVGDIDGDGRLDLIYPEAVGDFGSQMNFLRNVATLNRDGSNISRNRITVEVLDANGRQNQYGRRISVRPPGPIGDNPSPVLSRVVGSNGYLAQNQYVELIGTPYGGPHIVSVTFPAINSDGTVAAGTQVVSTTARAGDRLLFYSPPANNGLGSVTKRFSSISRFRDSDGDGKSDVFWRDTSGQINVWKMNDLWMESAAEIAIQTDSNAILAATGDFDGDGKADLVWHNPTTGEVRIWTVDGGTKTGDFRVGFVDTALGWNLAGVGDFDGDGRLDLLWFSPSTGTVKIWPMNGVSRRTFAGQPVEVVLQPTVDPTAGWTIAGVGDVDNDGISDIIWWNQTDGRVNHWLMTASMSVKPESGGIGTHTSPGTWKVVGVGDFNADGRTDVLWKDDASGDVEIWLTAGLYSYNSIPLAQGVIPQWRVANVGDYNGDGRADIFWRHDAGNVVVWRTQQNVTPDGTNESYSSVLGVVHSVSPEWDVYPKK
jgi:hypothetical protein